MADVCGGSGDDGDGNRRSSKEKRDSWNCRMIGIYIFLSFVYL
ncbi:hypothetical protein LINGRAPRIM_LOCUS3249 [Linum grandiflorum]